jgi:general secretion pathway protein K
VLRRWAHERADKGFVLALTLWIVAILGMVIAAMSTWVQTAVANAQVLRDRTDAQLAFADIRNELVYAIATRPRSPRGLEVGGHMTKPDPTDMFAIMSANIQSDAAVAFDWRPYVVESHPDYVIQIQDGRGLMPINRPDPTSTRRFLTALKIPESMRNRLADTLLDYIDEDTLTRAAGAEAPDYERLGLPPPPNRPLLTPYEAKHVLGWAGVKEIWETDMRKPLLTTCQEAGFNPNTASDIMLETYLPELSPEARQRIIARRAEKPFVSQTDLSEAAGELLFNQAFFFTLAPGRCSVVDITSRTTGEHIRLSLTVDPSPKSQPWRYDYEIRVPAEFNLPADSVDAKAVFPAAETLHSRDNPDASTLD